MLFRSSSTPAVAETGALGTDLAGMQAVTDGGFSFTVNGNLLDIIGCDFSEITVLPEVADVINYQSDGKFVAVYDSKTTKIKFYSLISGTGSTITVLGAPSTGTDISGSGYLNGAAATLTQGTGDDFSDRNIVDVINSAADGKFFVTYDGSALTFYSTKSGSFSSVSVLSAVEDGEGTDISGADFLNGLEGTAVAGTGGDGTNIPSGILLNSISYEDLSDDDVTGNMVLVGGYAVCDKEQVVLEGDLELTDVVPCLGKTIEMALMDCGIFLIDTFCSVS